MDEEKAAVGVCVCVCVQVAAAAVIRADRMLMRGFDCGWVSRDGFEEGMSNEVGVRFFYEIRRRGVDFEGWAFGSDW